MIVQEGVFAGRQVRNVRRPATALGTSHSERLHTCAFPFSLPLAASTSSSPPKLTAHRRPAAPSDASLGRCQIVAALNLTVPQSSRLIPFLGFTVFVCSPFSFLYNSTYFTVPYATRLMFSATNGDLQRARIGRRFVSIADDYSTGSTMYISLPKDLGQRFLSRL
ncbi:hypothetical protein BC827DRAFT_1217782 [Russula dissimulans]|jgi:hypothetical protein|nr:hypothetical protein BC827DRAFT_1217782 [Russula dissimulans]